MKIHKSQQAWVMQQYTYLHALRQAHLKFDIHLHLMAELVPNVFFAFYPESPSSYIF